MSKSVTAAMQALTKAGIRFHTKNNGSHIMIEHHSRWIDFWPTTGKWVVRGYHNRTDWGLERLIEYLTADD